MTSVGAGSELGVWCSSAIRELQSSGKEGELWTRGWAAGPKMSLLEMGLVFEGHHLILKTGS